ncbi:peroxisomal membrane PEX14 [Brachionus plicatilis]|uniref:Peroxisomal membrane PEX14 n=1 Tax=Brachionus plicatilis TaxID=10195 RepID=A0A3M7T6M9_BRAPC|nr:peroxisomal membrane PEX14 [Brachionus plicatilis]
MSEPPTELANTPVVQDRQDLIETAVRFLNNPKSSNEELKNSISDIKQSIDQLKVSIEGMNGSILSLAGQKQVSDETNVKSELKSIKSLLLSRQQFPSIPAVNPIIPSWQLETKASRENSPDKNEETKPEENSE